MFYVNDFLFHRETFSRAGDLSFECLDTRKCDKCGSVIYAPALTCYNCQTQWDMCVVSGYPLVGDNYHEFDDGQLQRDSFLSDLINLKIGTPYPAMGSHFGT